jgi:hypothetical protein
MPAFDVVLTTNRLITDAVRFDMIYLTAIGLTPGGSGTVHIYTQYTEYKDGTYIIFKKLYIHNNQKIN